jgi:phage gp29-like protein
MSPRQLKKINAWRAQFNPLRGLSIQRAVTLLEEGERGAYSDLQWVYRFIEKRDATLRGLVQLRTSAIKKLDWDIKLVDSAEPAAAERQAAALRAAYENISNLKEAVAFLALAEFRGYAHLEKRYEGDNPAQGIVRLEPVPQWHWCRDTMYGPWQYLADAGSGTNRGEPIEPAHFLIREVERPINEIGFICYLRKNLSQKDWDGFVETYGIPPLFVEMPAGVDPTREAEYQALAEAVIGDMRGTLPSGAKVQTAGDGARGVNPFRDHLTYQDEQLVLAGTSGKLTMLNGPTGLGSGQSDAHQDTFDQLAQAEAGEISELFQRQFDRAVLDAAGFVDQPALAYFELAAVDQTDVGQLLDQALKASQAGFRADAAELSEKTGLKLTLAPAAPAAPAFGPGPARVANRASPADPAAADLAAATKRRAVEALRAKLRPVLEALRAAAESEDDAAFDRALAEAQASLRDEAKKLDLSPDDPLVRAFAEGMSAALVNGAATGAQATTANRASGPLAWLRSLFSRR